MTAIALRFRKKESTMFRLLCVGLAISATSVIGCQPSTEKEELGFASPGEAWDAYRYACHEERWKDAFRCLTPEDQRRSIMGIIFTEAYLRKTPEKGTAAKLEAILTRFGLNAREMEAKVYDMEAKGAKGSASVEYVNRFIAGVKDKETLYDEAMKVVNRAKQRATRKDQKPPIELGGLMSVEISGDRARGEHMTRLDDSEVFLIGPVRQTEIKDEQEFRKIGGRWFVGR